MKAMEAEKAEVLIYVKTLKRNYSELKAVMDKSKGEGELAETIITLQKRLEEEKKSRAALQETLEKSKNVVKKTFGALIAEKNKALEERDKAIEERDKAIEEKKIALSEKEMLELKNSALQKKMEQKIDTLKKEAKKVKQLRESLVASAPPKRARKKSKKKSETQPSSPTDLPLEKESEPPPSLSAESDRNEKDQDSNNEAEEEPKLLVMENNVVKGATLELLVERLVWYKAVDSSNLVSTVLLTYRSFTTPEEILRLLLARFNVPAEELVSEGDDDKLAPTTKKKIIQVRVGNVLKNWLDTHPEDFLNNEDLCKDFKSTVKQTMEEANMTNLSELLVKQLEDTLNHTLRKKIPNPLHPPKSIAPTSNSLLGFHPTELARQLTLLEFNFFRAITPKECLRQAWNKNQAASPNVVKMIQWFNLISTWVCHEVVKEIDLKKRAHILKKLLQTVVELEQLRNLNGIQEILAGLALTPVWRLKATWARIGTNAKSAELLSKYQQYQELMSSQHAYSKYRKMLATLSPPAIPYLGIHLHDLTHIEDGNLDYFDEELKVINIDKRRKIAQVISELQQFQQGTYPLMVESTIMSHLVTIDNLPDEETLYAMSLACEKQVEEKFVTKKRTGSFISKFRGS
eukprot:TRINITY_DN5313_c0_g1_i1.p1 TRINITY_DN5313_c0_g1~~TRINITY_DN5313_c0_g1_i1.p1  ORF type:complete len:670 (-),score=154.58 TRINITY_DN5313_c0_g1_i1:100-1995(-)